jgi:hypothetical protein
MGVSIGTAGGSLTGQAAAWVGDDQLARVGLAGEQQVGAILDHYCGRPGGGTVLHDLRIPGSVANIDHLVVSGSRVWLVDAKNWAPGVYWRLFGLPMRGRHRFLVAGGVSPADKQTMSMARDRLTRWLKGRGVSCGWMPATVAVRPSKTGGRVSVCMLGMPDAHTVGLAGFRRLAWWRCRGAANPSLVSVLRPLVRGV